jgi:hypothetical protein
LQLNNGIWSPTTDSGQDGSGTHAPQGFPFLITGSVSDCQQPDWVAVSPESNILAAGTAEQVSVAFDSTGLGAGTYTGKLCLTRSDSNNPFLSLPITLTSLAPGLILTTTIGIEPDECATTHNLYAPQPVTAYYCYTASNSGNIPLSLHDLEDSYFGPIFTAFPLMLAPGASIDTVSAGRSLSATVSASRVTTATWTAYNVGLTDVVSDSDTAAVIIGTPGLTFQATVGTSAAGCAGQSQLVVPIGTAVHYCYQVTNTGEVPLEMHNLSESAYGLIFSGYAHTLYPGESFNTVAAGITHTVLVMTDTVSTAVWTASSAPLIQVTASGATAVNTYIPRFLYMPFVIRP